MTPCSIFMTFETEAGIERALIFNKTINASKDKSLQKLQYWIDGDHKVEIQKAPLPMDIIWENKQESKKTQNKKIIIANILVSLMLLGSSGL